MQLIKIILDLLFIELLDNPIPNHTVTATTTSYLLKNSITAVHESFQ